MKSHFDMGCVCDTTVTVYRRWYMLFKKVNNTKEDELDIWLAVPCHTVLCFVVGRVEGRYKTRAKASCCAVYIFTALKPYLIDEAMMLTICKINDDISVNFGPKIFSLFKPTESENNKKKRTKTQKKKQTEECARIGHLSPFSMRPQSLANKLLFGC